MCSPSRPASVAQMMDAVSGALSSFSMIRNWLAVRSAVRNCQDSGIMGNWARDQRAAQAPP